ncbi:hypothetical protein VNO80_33225 [Phaseolus coccineus]|uniref:Uncharacterized protein n=1 Tax=Phaseolus coccineus TaxID=3886 RepID=A0AAN9Q637_PHACN
MGGQMGKLGNANGTFGRGLFVNIVDMVGLAVMCLLGKSAAIVAHPGRFGFADTADRSSPGRIWSIVACPERQVRKVPTSRKKRLRDWAVVPLERVTTEPPRSSPWPIPNFRSNTPQTPSDQHVRHYILPLPPPTLPLQTLAAPTPAQPIKDASDVLGVNGNTAREPPPCGSSSLPKSGKRLSQSQWTPGRDGVRRHRKERVQLNEGHALAGSVYRCFHNDVSSSRRSFPTRALCSPVHQIIAASLGADRRERSV